MTIQVRAIEEYITVNLTSESVSDTLKFFAPRNKNGRRVNSIFISPFASGINDNATMWSLFAIFCDFCHQDNNDNFSTN